MSDDYQWYENELNQQRYYEAKPMDTERDIVKIKEVSIDIMEILQSHNKLDKLSPENAVAALIRVLVEVVDLTLKDTLARPEYFKGILQSIISYYEEEENNGK